MLRCFVEKALKTYLDDNGAEDVSKRHLQPMTDKIMCAIAKAAAETKEFPAPTSPREPNSVAKTK